MRGRRRCLGLGAAVLAGSAMAANATPQVADGSASVVPLNVGVFSPLITMLAKK